MERATRRVFMRRAFGVSLGMPLGGALGLAMPTPGDGTPDEFREGRRVGTLRFVGGRGRRLERTTGRGLEGRRAIDLSTLTPETLVIPNERFFIRTRRPDRIDDRGPWRIRVGGHVDGPASIDAAAVERRATDRGEHLLECSGNGSSFGLIGVAQWSGVPLTSLLEDLPVRRAGTGVLVSGFDDHSGDSGSSRIGASWVFTFRDLARTGAFLATGMNGGPLPPDHGFPVRLVVPGWYGCTCIKWVDEIRLVDATVRATPHMREFAARTQQNGVPRVAREFRPAEIDLAAVPIRVERWRVGGRLIHRVVGIVWGGNDVTDSLRIRFNGNEPAMPVACPRETTATWGLWSHAWQPAKPGRYRITLHPADPTARTRRLDRGYYARTVIVKEV